MAEAAADPGTSSPTQDQKSVLIPPSTGLDAMRAVAAAFLLSRAVIVVAVIGAPFIMPEQVLPRVAQQHTGAPWLIDAMVRWDALHYISIAAQGYHQGIDSWDTNIPFFPLYPALLALLDGWGGTLGLAYAGVLVSNLAFLGSLWFLYRLVQADFGAAMAGRTVLYLAVFPTSLFFSAVYAESLFLLLVLACFWLLRQQQWVAAAIVGALAAATRPPGALLALVFLWEYLRGSRLQLPNLVRAGAGAAIVLGGTLSVMLLHWLQMGDPLAFIHLQRLWDRQVGSPLDQATGVVQALTTRGFPGFELLFPLIVTLGFVTAGTRLFSGYRSSYALWFWVYMALVLSTPAVVPLFSVTRFLLGAFPAFIVFARLGENRLFHAGFVIAGLGLLFVSAAVFAQWYWVA